MDRSGRSRQTGRPGSRPVSRAASASRRRYRQPNAADRVVVQRSMALRCAARQAGTSWSERGVSTMIATLPGTRLIRRAIAAPCASGSSSLSTRTGSSWSDGDDDEVGTESHQAIDDVLAPRFALGVFALETRRPDAHVHEDAAVLRERDEPPPALPGQGWSIAGNQWAAWESPTRATVTVPFLSPYTQPGVRIRPARGRTRRRGAGRRRVGPREGRGRSRGRGPSSRGARTWGIAVGEGSGTARGRWRHERRRRRGSSPAGDESVRPRRAA